MTIVVCLKQVPEVASVKMDPETKRLLRDSATAVLNPFDYYALEAAVRLKEEIPAASVVALTMGPPKAAEALREALAFGADAAILLSDPRFAGSDTWATSHVLALAIRKIGDVALV
ncbi:MAG: electron transfer flavoprotein subunit beta, partial [Lentisphaeria bacterium]